MIKLSGRLLCKSLAEVALVQQFLPEHIRLTQAEAGCLSFAVTQSADPLIWHVEELFTDQESFTAHQVRTKASLWGAETLAIIREYQISEVS